MEIRRVTIGKGKSVHFDGLPDVIADRQPRLVGLAEPVYVPACSVLAGAKRADKTLTVLDTVQLAEAFESPACAKCAEAGRILLTQEKANAKREQPGLTIPASGLENYYFMSKEANTDQAKAYWGRLVERIERENGTTDR